MFSNRTQLRFFNIAIYTKSSRRSFFEPRETKERRRQRPHSTRAPGKKSGAFHDISFILCRFLQPVFISKTAAAALIVLAHTFNRLPRKALICSLGR
jgi:hypothetical protein